MTFTFEEMESALNLAVETKGEDYVYELPQQNVCTYSTRTDGEPEPSCIVGHVINTLSPEAFKLIASREWKNGHFMSSVSAPNIERSFNVKLWGDKEKDKILNFLTAAQTRQDSGQNWGIARNATYNAIGEY